MKDQRTSPVSARPVSARLAKHVGRMVEDAALVYQGGLVKLELVKGDPDFISELYKLFDVRAAARAQTLAITERPPWKRIRLGTHQSVEQLRQAVLDAGCKIGTWGDDILGRITVATEPSEIDLYLFSGTDLGYPNSASRAQIYTAADGYGFAPCPAEVGPQLRKQYLDQPKGEVVLVAMEPIADSVGGLGVFGVGHVGSGLWLGGDNGFPGNFWIGGIRWVFRRK